MKFEDFSLRVSYETDGKEVVVSDGDGIISVEKIAEGDRFVVRLDAAKKVRLISARMVASREFAPEERFFGGGYQSWSLTREYSPKDRQKGLRNVAHLPVVRTFAAASGDYDFARYGRKLYHSHGYTYIRRGSATELFGSLDESFAFTLFYLDAEENVFAVVKDVEGAEIEGGVTLFDLFRAEGTYDEVFDRYFALYPLKAPRRGIKRLAGYTSWYNYYQNVTEKIVLRDLEGMYGAAGRDAKGRPVIGGFAWNGFYVLDHEKAEVRQYIKSVFDAAIDEWGYDMFKLDFLYAACMTPRNGKSRGRLMHEAMSFLRECVRDKLLLGCGVPMASSFGFVDACRTGCDAELSYQDKLYVKCTNSEIISTRNSVIDTVFRRHLNGRVFLSDPDVFFLRDDGMKPTSYTQSQKEVLAKVNKMFGSVLFVSDNAGDYDAKRRAMLLDAFAPLDGTVLSAEMVGKDRINVGFVEKGVEKVFSFDLSTGDYSVRAVK